VLHARVRKYIGKHECMWNKTPEHTCNAILVNALHLCGPCSKSIDRTM